MNAYRKGKPPSSKLRLVANKPTILRLGGTPASADMKPGDYLARCESAWIKRSGQNHVAVFQFCVVDGKFGGTELRLWVTVADASGFISQGSRYARYCAIALGRPLADDDPIDDPAQIFCATTFKVSVGYRKTDKARGGRYSEENSLVRKGTDDYLRVHEILSREF
jgi:hypothetical protein